MKPNATEGNSVSVDQVFDRANFVIQHFQQTGEIDKADGLENALVWLRGLTDAVVYLEGKQPPAENRTITRDELIVKFPGRGTRKAILNVGKEYIIAGEKGGRGKVVRYDRSIIPVIASRLGIQVPTLKLWDKG